jgi:SAM-dependent methyltransferase
MVPGTDGLAVDPTNAESARAWDGDEGAFWAANAERFDRSVAGYHSTLMTAAAIRPHEWVLDVGCGTGQTTRDAAVAANSGAAVGVDLSAAMLDVARELAAAQGIGNVRFEQGDAQIHPFPAGQFDVVISRTGTMFFGDRTAAFANLARALRPDGRLTMLVWRGPAQNEWIRELLNALSAGCELPAPPVGAPGPFAYADPDEAQRVLTATGFATARIDAVAAPMWWGSDPADAHRFVLGLMSWLLHGLDDAAVHRAHEALRTTLDAHTTPAGVTFESAAWLIHARRA